MNVVEQIQKKVNEVFHSEKDSIAFDKKQNMIKVTYAPGTFTFEIKDKTGIMTFYYGMNCRLSARTKEIEEKDLKNLNKLHLKIQKYTCQKEQEILTNEPDHKKHGCIVPVVHVKTSPIYVTVAEFVINI